MWGFPSLLLEGQGIIPEGTTWIFCQKKTELSYEKPPKTKWKHLETKDLTWTIQHNVRIWATHSTKNSGLLGWYISIKRCHKLILIGTNYAKLCAALCFLSSSSLFQQKWQFSTVDRYEMVRASTSSTVVAFVEYLSFSAIHTLWMLAHISNYLLV